MRLETGSNKSLSHIVISVRLRSGGDPFLLPSTLPDSISPEDGVQLSIEVLTKRSLLIPKSQILDTGDRYATFISEFANIGVIVGDDEQVVSLDYNEVVGVAAVPIAFVSEINRRFDSCYKFTLPLLTESVNRRPHMLLDSVDGVTVIKVFGDNSELQFADVYDTPTSATVIFWVEQLASSFDFKRYILYINRGDRSLRSLLSGNFKNAWYANNKRRV